MRVVADRVSAKSGDSMCRRFAFTPENGYDHRQRREADNPGCDQGSRERRRRRSERDGDPNNKCHTDPGRDGDRTASEDEEEDRSAHSELEAAIRRPMHTAPLDESRKIALPRLDERRC